MLPEHDILGAGSARTTSSRVSTGVASASGRSLAETVSGVRLQVAAEGAWTGFVVTLIAIAGLAVLLGDALGPCLALSLLGAASCSALRVHLARTYLATGTAQPEQRSWARDLAVVGGLNGLFWGLVVSALIMLDTPDIRLIASMLLGVVSVAPLPSFGALNTVYMAYLAGLLGPVVVVFLLGSDRLGPLLAGLVLAYGGLVTVLARRFHARLLETTRVAFENAGLARKLAVARARSDEALVRLETERDERRGVQRQLSHVTRHDALTGLMNRYGFESVVRGALARTRGEAHAVIFVDLDHFKLVNDTRGHAAGDALLRRAGALIRRSLRKHDLVARFGDDEFGVFLESCSLDEARRLAETLRAGLERERLAGDQGSLAVTASIGVAPATSGIDDFDGVFAAANGACHTAKDLGRNRVHVYRADDSAMMRRSEQMYWASQIPEALVANRFALVRQSIVGIGDSARDAQWYEVLLRMRDKAGHYVLPDAFIPAAERYFLADALDLWVVESVLERLSNDLAELDRLGKCFINMSGQSLSKPSVLEHVAEIVAASEVPADRLCFEITETSAITNITDALRAFERLRLLGCSFALDDFGSGFSSFGYLRDLPVEYLKIDGSFVREIAHDPVARSIVGGITEIGHASGKQIIAEHVEDPETLTVLRALDVDMAQGFGIASPASFLE